MKYTKSKHSKERLMSFDVGTGTLMKPKSPNIPLETNAIIYCRVSDSKQVTQ